MNELNEAIVQATTAMLVKFNNNLNKSQRESIETLDHWARYLTIDKGFTVAQIGHAIKSLMSSGPKFMPSAYEIEACLAPAQESNEDKAELIAEEIIRHVQAFGYMQVDKAFQAMSEEARIAAGSPSYLLDVCNTPSDDATVLRAQIRKRAKAALERHQNREKNEKLVSIGIAVPNVLPMKRPEMMRMDYSKFLPEEPA